MEEETMSRREVRVVAALIGYFNTLDADDAIRTADDFTAKLFGDTPLGPAGSGTVDPVVIT